MSSQQHPSGRSPARLRHFSDLEFVLRFEYGHMAEAAEICGSNDGSSLGGGFARLHKAHIPWTIQYDEMLILIEGELRVHVGAEIFRLQPRDSLWLPAGTELIYQADRALVAYAIHPANWHEV